MKVIPNFYCYHVFILLYLFISHPCHLLILQILDQHLIYLSWCFILTSIVLYFVVQQQHLLSSVTFLWPSFYSHLLTLLFLLYYQQFCYLFLLLIWRGLRVNPFRTNSSHLFHILSINFDY